MGSSWSIRGVGVCSLACACATTGVRDRTSAEETSRGPLAVRPAEEKEPTAAQHAPGPRNGARTNELAAPGTDDRFAVAQQVAVLERSIELYQMFLERAGNDPQYAEAVERSRGRIEDARLTICFLLEKPCEGAAEAK